MDYRKELDALKAERGAIVARLAAPLPEQIKPTVAVMQASIHPIPDEPRSYNLARTERDQISERIRNFRAHQEQVRVEREHYYSHKMSVGA